MLFRPLSEPPQAGSNLDIEIADCTPPVGSEICSPNGNTPQTVPYANQAGGVCLAPIPGTSGPGNTGSYSPAIDTPSGPCFDTASVTISFPFGLFTVPLQNLRGAATYDDDPANNLLGGLLQGFLSESDANSILIPSSIAILGGQPISVLLPGGMGGCAPTDDRDLGPMSQSGWYFYLNFTAHRVSWTGS